MQSTSAEAEAVRSPNLRILAAVCLTFVGYLGVGLPLAVLPQYVASGLGYGAVLAGLTISTQYLATIVSRAQVGRMSDIHGPKPGVLIGFVFYGASGLLTLAAALHGGTPGLALGLLLVGRLALGVGESGVSTGAITWAIGEVGPEHTVKIISWNGIATYGGLAMGAPLGVGLAQYFGVWSIGLTTCCLALLGLGLSMFRPGVTMLTAARLSMASVVGRILPYGLALAFASAGFGVIGAFVTLFFASRQWSGASASLSLFGIGFIGARLIMGGFIQRHGGLRVSLVALVVECAGLAVLWTAPGPTVAMLGAGLTGFGFAPIFPALGMVAVGKVPPQNRGAAIGLFSVFLDVALGATGPIAGLLIDHFGFAAPFGLGVAAALASMAIVAVLLAG